MQQSPSLCARPPNPAPLLLDAQETARALHISPRLLWRLSKDNQIPHVRIGRRVLYDPKDLDVWIAAHKSGPPAPSTPRPGAKMLDTSAAGA